jgi:hypothetical protein
LPSKMEVLVTPTSVAETGVLLVPPHPARVTRKATSAASRRPVLAI